jgi:hypothetical protein
MNEKGQAFSYDFLVAFIIFIVLINAMYLAWGNNVTHMRYTREFERARFAASTTVDNLTLLPGKPSYWENDIDTNYYGLVTDEYDLSLNKLNALAGRDYSTVKSGLNIDEYEFILTVVQDSNTVFSYGQGLPDPRFVIGIERVVTYNGRPAKLYFKLYQNNH